ncbi:MAG: thiamine phosphate synthase [Terriglobales bacterium]|jgi:thiamine-phosphate pyrophosphorylase
MADRCLLYYITDRSQFPGDEFDRRGALLAKVSEAASAGVDYIQLREKDLSAKELEMLAGDALRARCDRMPPGTGNRQPRTRLLINHRTDVALAVGADGVHLRSNDVAAYEVRQVMAVSARGPLANDPPVVCVSCHTAADVFRAEAEQADFAVFAPVFEKRAAPGTRPTGLAALHTACQAGIPVFALGGVTLQNAAACRKAGASGIAAIRLFQENKIEDVVCALRSLEGNG